MSSNLSDQVYETSVIYRENQLGNMQSISDYRLELLNRFCSQFKLKKNTQLNETQVKSVKDLLEGAPHRNVIYNDRFKFVECRVPKTGMAYFYYFNDHPMLAKKKKL